MNGHHRQQRCRDLPDCHNVRLIDLSFVPKQARFAECDELSSTAEENMNTMYSGNLSKQHCSDKDFPRVANKCSHMDTLREGNMKHEP